MSRTAPPLPIRNLGPLEVPALGYGAMALSGTYGSTDDASGAQALLAAIDAGATFIDTADRYGLGHNEELIGRTLGSRRSEVVLASKFGMHPFPGSPSRGIPVRMDFGELRVNNDPALVRRYAERSLRALRTDHLDLYYPHWPDPSIPIEDTIGAVAELVEAGLVRHLGLSNVNADQLRAAHSVHPVAAVQVQWAMWHRPDTSLIAAADELGVGIVAWSPLGNGFLTGTIERLAERDYRRSVSRFDDLAENNDRFAPIRRLAGDLAITPGQLALAWLLHQHAHVVPIPGSRTAQHIQENVDAASIRLDGSTLARVELALTRFRPSGTVAVRRD